MNNELLVIEKFELELVPFFTKGDRLDDLLGAIKVEVMAHVPDVSTLKGRNAIKANITAGKKYRTHLEECGKKLSAEYKLMPKTIDKYRNKVNTFLFEVEAEARKELTAWEVIDKAEKAQAVDTEAFLIEYELKHEEGFRDNELIDLKAAQAEADHKAEIKAAADAATKKAEDEAAEKIQQAKQGLIDSEQREAKAKQATKNAEWLTYITEAYEINSKIDADKQAVIAAEEARKREELAQWIEYINEAYAHNDQLIAAENARLTEVKRQQDLAAKEKADTDAREANKRHCAKINTAAMNAFIVAGLNANDAKLAVKALAKNLIPSATINY